MHSFATKYENFSMHLGEHCSASHPASFLSGIWRWNPSFNVSASIWWGNGQYFPSLVYVLHSFSFFDSPVLSSEHSIYRAVRAVSIECTIFQISLLALFRGDSIWGCASLKNVIIYSWIEVLRWPAAAANTFAFGRRLLVFAVRSLTFE